MLPRESGQSRVPDPPAMMTPYSMYIAYPRYRPRPPVQLYRSRKRRGMRYNGMQFLPRRIMRTTRRQFLGTTIGGGLVMGGGGVGFVSGLRPVTAAGAEVEPAVVRLDSGIEPAGR